MSSATEQNARAVADESVRTAPAWPEGRFGGRGIVICGGGDRYFPSAWVCIRMLRQLGCELPIELWQLWSSELSEPLRRLVERQGVRCVDASAVRRQFPVRILNGWELKPFAILHSAFEGRPVPHGPREPKFILDIAQQTNTPIACITDPDCGTEWQLTLKSQTPLLRIGHFKIRINQGFRMPRGLWSGRKDETVGWIGKIGAICRSQGESVRRVETHGRAEEN